MHRYTAHRVDSGWRLEGGTGQPSVFVRRLHDAHDRIRSALTDADGTPSESIGIQLDVDLGEDLGADVRAAIQATVDARKAQTEAAARLRRAAASMRAMGLTGRDISHVLGVSPQRVSQLLNDRQ